NDTTKVSKALFKELVKGPKKLNLANHFVYKHIPNVVDLTKKELEVEQKARERVAIQTVITAKKTRITTTKQNTTPSLKELSEAMFQQTNSALPNALNGALQGKSAESAEKFLKGSQRPNLKTPVKGE
ncbi:5-bromo-4-chloroindolyl phosphate hydrolysis family protein, partial [Enterococcus faecalis]|uniref:5-bromo-4-chloroindolyl phosphate hydrolysis family protein n=1 Tax=Enterococcus faecalis TaxID=1351 RepID=UPI003D6BEA1C